MSKTEKGENLKKPDINRSVLQKVSERNRIGKCGVDLSDTGYGEMARPCYKRTSRFRKVPRI